MKDTLLNQAKENGHVMIRVSPGRYECRDCDANIEDNQAGNNNWQSSKIGNLCPGVKQESSGFGGNGKPLAV